MADIVIEGFSVRGGVGLYGVMPTHYDQAKGEFQNPIGSIAGNGCTGDLIQKSSVGVGLTIDPYNFGLENVPMTEGCPFQNGDTIIITTITILFVDVTIIEWNLSSGSGSKTEVGFALDGGVDNVRYEIQNVRRVTP